MPPSRVQRVEHGAGVGLGHRFDAGAGALTRIDIRGRGGRSLTEDWDWDIRTTMGLMVHGYPNLLTTAVPLAPSAALCNLTTRLQQQTCARRASR